MLDCLFIGSATEDMILTVDAPPRSDQKIAVTGVIHTPGGIANVAASAFNKLGGKTGLIISVGDPGSATDYVTNDAKNKNLEFLDIITMPGLPTSFSVIMVEEDGKRLIANQGGTAKAITPQMIDMDVVKNSKIVHMGGVSKAMYEGFAKVCKECTDTIVSIDGGNIDLETTNNILPFVDIFIPDHKTVERTLGISPKEACEYYVKKGVKIAVVTCGENGLCALCDGEYYEIPAFKTEVLDTTGAGDNFHGAFLYGYSRGWEMQKTLEFASAFAALTCRCYGGIYGEPTFSEVEAMLKAGTNN